MTSRASTPSAKPRAASAPVTLKLRISDEEAARFAVDRWRFPGVDVVPYLSRRYPHGALFAHVIGYVGRIDERDLAKLGEDEHRVHATPARPASSATTRTRCAAASVTSRSRPMSTAAPWAPSAGCRRRPAPTCA